MTMKTSEKCPCGSTKSFGECCNVFLSGSALPRTAEDLMRARYSAYVVDEVDYIQNTNAPDDEEPFDVESARKWAKDSEWLGLEILDVTNGSEHDETGEVEFRARYKNEGKEYVHHEHSHFKKMDGKWCFSSGHLIQQPEVRTEPKIGRNDPCTCGSGKKYKKCCGR